MQPPRRKIRSQMFFGVTMLFFIVTVLSVASFQGVLKFRKLTKNIKARATELPAAAKISLEVSRFSSTVFRIPQGGQLDSRLAFLLPSDLSRVQYRNRRQIVSRAITDYEEGLNRLETSDSWLGGVEEETQMIKKMRVKLAAIHEMVNCPEWDFVGDSLDDEIFELQRISSELPTLLKARMDDFSTQARTEYHTWMALTGITSLCAFGLIVLLFKRFREAIFKPLEQLLDGTRKVAAGDDDFRIKLNSDDELAELAESFNLMTTNFQSIKKDLNQQVQERTKEVVRSEQMASVGFLAAGVAHEINNPLNTIAWSAESLEARLHEMLADRFDGAGSLTPELMNEIKKNLRRIQDEAFRCKGITDSLLDFSRLGDAKKNSCDMRELVESVVEMVRPLGKYRLRNIDFQCSESVMALVNPQEMKQVSLNLITNALDSVADGGHVQVMLANQGGRAVLTVKDDGCGMTDEVKQHLFEPFFTRREPGMGTGLGLSITYRIVEEHGGVIEPQSDGPGLGSKFIVRIPTVQNEQKRAA